MKRIVLLLIVIGMVSVGVIAQELSTKNAVGVIKMDLPKGFTLACLPVQTMQGGQVITNLLDPDGLPEGTLVYIWDEVLQTYKPDTEQIFDFGSKFWNPGTNVLTEGMSFWIRIPDGAPLTNYVLTLFGEVPDQTNTVVNLRSKAFSFTAYTFPTQTAITNSGLDAIAENGDILYYWAGTWQSVSRIFGVWDNPTFIFQPGEGILYYSFSAADKDWDQPKPYPWP